MPQIITNLNVAVHPDLRAKLQRRAIAEKCTLRDLVTRYLEAGLQGKAAK